MVSERNYSEVHQGETLLDLRWRRFAGALFADCTFRDVSGAVFQDCVLHGSRLDTEDIREMLGVTLSLDCFTFDGLHLSPTALDGFLYLLTMTAGNDETRAKVEAAIDPARLKLFRRIFANTE